MGALLWPVFNLLILIGLLVYYLREPLKTFVRTRHETIRD